MPISFFLARVINSLYDCLRGCYHENFPLDTINDDRNVFRLTRLQVRNRREHRARRGRLTINSPNDRPEKDKATLR